MERAMGTEEFEQLQIFGRRLLLSDGESQIVRLLRGGDGLVKPSRTRSF